MVYSLVGSNLFFHLNVVQSIAPRVSSSHVAVWKVVVIVVVVILVAAVVIVVVVVIAVVVLSRSKIPTTETNHKFDVQFHFRLMQL